MEFVSWDDYPIYEMESHKTHVPNHQPATDFVRGFPSHVSANRITKFLTKALLVGPK